jgi:hypothetical protein
MPLTEQAATNTGAVPGQVLADAGYSSADNFDRAADYTAACGTEFFIATGRPRRGDPPWVAPRGRIPANATEKQRMARKLTTKTGQKVYARRKAIIEPVFGQMHTLQNAKHLPLRGLEQARDEWLLLAACHNRRKLRGHIGVHGLVALAASRSPNPSTVECASWALSVHHRRRHADSRRPQRTIKPIMSRRRRCTRGRHRPTLQAGICPRRFGDECLVQ